MREALRSQARLFGLTDFQLMPIVDGKFVSQHSDACSEKIFTEIKYIA
jgi:hypothetical protein